MVVVAGSSGTVIPCDCAEAIHVQFSTKSQHQNCNQKSRQIDADRTRLLPGQNSRHSCGHGISKLVEAKFQLGNPHINMFGSYWRNVLIMWSPQMTGCA